MYRSNHLAISLLPRVSNGMVTQERAAATLLKGHQRLTALGLAGTRLIQSDAGSDFTSGPFQHLCQTLGQWVCSLNRSSAPATTATKGRANLGNAALHKRADFQNLLRQAGHTLEYLPPDSPDINPIEPKWAQTQALRKQSQCAIKDLYLLLPSTVINLIWFCYTGRFDFPLWRGRFD